MIKLRNITKEYYKKKILDRVSLDIYDGEMVAITGKSGSGKTTLLNTIGLLEKGYDGTIEFDGKIPSKHDIMLLQRYKIAYVFQNYALIENDTVNNNLKIALRYKKIKNKDKEIRSALEIVGLKGAGLKKVCELSGGEQQRVALARAYLKDPQYLFADEPTGNLDSINRDIIFDIMKELNKNGTTVVFVTHDKELANRAGRVISVEDI